MSCDQHRRKALARIGKGDALETVFQVGKIDSRKADRLERSVCGNIYLDVFSDQGRRFRNYSVDCAECVTEVYLEKVGRRKRTKTAAEELGWRRGADGKWRCPQCVSKTK